MHNLFLKDTRAAGKINYCKGGLLNSQHGRIDAEVVIGGHAPMALGKEIIVLAPRAVGFLDELAGALGLKAQPLADALYARLERGADEHVQAVPVAQHVIGRPADEDGIRALGYAPDGLALDAEDVLVADGAVVRNAAEAAHREERGGVEKGVLLVIATEKRGAQPALLRRLGDELLVVNRDVQQLSEFESDALAATAEFAADVDDGFTHMSMIILRPGTRRRRRP